MAYGGFGGGMNMNAIMQQARKMQEQMEKAQQELENAEVVGKAGGDMVQITMTGKKELKSVKLNKNAVDPDDVEMLEDLLVVAFNDAIAQADELSKDKNTGIPAQLQKSTQSTYSSVSDFDLENFSWKRLLAAYLLNNLE